MPQAGVRPSSAVQHIPSKGRVADLDLIRGLVLCFIFINHVPGNLFEKLTPKNFGLSDSSEAFVFLSGVSLALAYATRFADGRAWQVVQSLKRRVVRLYGLHVLLSFAAIAIYAAGAELGQDDTLMNIHGRDLFVDDPWAALLGLLSLGHQLGYFNILPLYLVLIAFLVAQLALARISLVAMLAASVLLYGAARGLDLNIPTWPMKGAWFFNPLAWQLLMALGVACGVLYRRGALPRNPAAILMAGIIALGGALVVTDGLGYWPGLHDQLRPWLDIDKGSLGLGRLIHFAAIAYLVFALRLTRVFTLTALDQPLCQLGRNSLAVFTILSILAAAGQVVTTLGGNTILLDCLVIGGGLAILFGAARLLETRQTDTILANGRLGTERR